MSYLQLAIIVSAMAVGTLARPEVPDSMDLMKEELEILKKCNEEAKAPESAIESLLNLREIDSSKEGKCLVKCAIMKMNIMKEDGHIDQEIADNYILLAYTKQENQAKVKTIWDGCVARVEKVEDNCEHAYSLVECFLEEAKKANIPRIHHDKHDIH